jgi:phosphate transport system substrate-binding protein
MNGKHSRFLIIATSLAAVLMLALAAGCTTNETRTPVATQEKQTIKISGSTTVLPIIQKAADQYMTTHANADIQISGGGSGAGIQAIGTKTVDIGMSSREVTADEKVKYPAFIVTAVAHDGIAIIVNPANGIHYITLDQIRDIYLGTISRWNEISGATVPGTSNQIVVIGRDSASGTRLYFDESILAKKTPTKQMLEKNSNGAVLQTVAQTPGAIGYVSIGFVSNDVKALPIWYNADRIIAPSLATVKDKSYPVSRDLYVITNGQPSGLTADFIQFILSAEGQKIVADEGYVTI